MCNKKYFKLTLISIAVAASLISGCEKEGPAERIGESLDNTAENIEQSFDDAAEKVKDAGKDLGNSVEDACEDLKESAGSSDTDC